MSHDLWSTFAELIRLPFHHEQLVWGIVPLYFGWAMNELTSAKVTFNTAIQTGFALLWSGAYWAWQAFRNDPAKVVGLNTHGLFAVNSAHASQWAAVILDAGIAGVAAVFSWRGARW